MARHTPFPFSRTLLPVLCWAFAGIPCVPAEPSPAAGPGTQTTLAASATVSSADGAETSFRASVGGAEVRLWAAWPFSLLAADPSTGPSRLSGGVGVPYLRAGRVRTRGLALFLCRPAAAGPILLGVSGSPAELENPEYAPYLGASVGEDFGALYLASAAEPGNRAVGAWASPRDLRFSAMAASGREIAHPNGEGWYDPPQPAVDRVWAALSAEAGGTDWAMAAAGAVGASFPGSDHHSARVEGWIRLGPLHIELEASSASASWRGFDAKAAPPLRAEASAVYSRRGIAFGGAWRGVQPEAGASLETRAAGFAEAVGAPGRGRISASVSSGADGEPRVLELETRLSPRILPWLSLSTSWLASGGDAVRFDIGSTVRFGRRAPIAIETGARMVPEGTLVDLAAEWSFPTGKAVVSLGAGSGGWVEAASLSPAKLVYRLGARVPGR